MDSRRRGEAGTAPAPVHAHLVGVAGPGMSGLAHLLVASGVKVSGTEIENYPVVERLRRLGARVHSGHPRTSCPKSAEYLIVCPETGRFHRHRLSALRRGLPEGSPVQWLGHFMQGSLGLAVAGQRDAGVASAMIGWILTRAGLDPTVVVGTPVPQLGGWARAGAGAHFVVEAVDDAEDLGPLGPRVAVLLNVACSRGCDPALRVAAIRRFASSVPAGGGVLALAANDLLKTALGDLGPDVEWLSLEPGSDWWGTDLHEDRGRYRFRTFHRGRFALEVRLQVPGRRNVLCALAAIAGCLRLDVPVLEIKDGLEEFTGLSADFESRGSYRGVTLVDDEGRDPSAVSESLAIGRQIFGSRRLWAVFLAAAERWTSEDVGRFNAAFAAADRVVIMDERRGDPGPDGTHALVQKLVATGTWARLANSLEGAIRDLDRDLEPGDVLVTLGTGGVGTIADAFIRRLSRDRQG